MKTYVVIIIFGIMSSSLVAQGKLTGIVKEKTESGNFIPLLGANIIWKGTTIGTTSDSEGRFEIPYSNESKTLIVSYIGYKYETLTINEQNSIEVVLIPEAAELNKVEVIESAPSTQIDYLGVENTSVLTRKELQKAACCTLAESFETNPSIDVSFTDAITGVRQIEMFGLSGIYTQTTMEALPYIRGLMSNVGLSFVPGTWINAINVSKGVGSVANGYESITGQIDIGMQKPFGIEDEKNAFLNFYGDNEKRFEGNLNFRYMLNENISSITLAHASSRQHSQDDNFDNFLDMPTSKVFNLMQRWQYLSFEGWESQFGFQILSDKKQGGTISSITQPNSFYKFGSTNTLVNIYGKTGYVFQEEHEKSFGLQWSYNHYDNSSNFGSKKYDGNEKNIYLNLIYQSNIFNESHIIRSGVSFVYDELRENFLSENFNRIEKVPGAFIEYTYKPNEEFSLVSGVRGDIHNVFGFLFTPRLHVRYSPEPDWVFRGAFGRGHRTPNIFVEYSSSFTSSRQVNILKSNNFGIGLEHESAWNYGINVTHYFLYDYRDATLSLDFYRTSFDNSTIANLDSNPQEINFSSVKSGAYSNTFQAELNIEPILFLNVRAAYKFTDAKQFINGKWLEKPFTAKHRMLLNFAYSSEKEKVDGPQMLYDLTLQWYGKKRIPSTASNPFAFRGRNSSPGFILVNTQVTRSFSELFDLYIGVENLFDFKQNDPIIDPTNPNGQYFDASLIWGPITGRMMYSGIRYKL